MPICSQSKIAPETQGVTSVVVSWCVLRTVTGKPELVIDFSVWKSWILPQRGRPSGGEGGFN